MSRLSSAVSLLPLLLATFVGAVSVQASNCTNAAWGEPNCSIYLANLDRTDFLNAFLKFGIPCVRAKRAHKAQPRGGTLDRRTRLRQTTTGRR